MYLKKLDLSKLSDDVVHKIGKIAIDKDWDEFKLIREEGYVRIISTDERDSYSSELEIHDNFDLDYYFGSYCERVCLDKQALIRHIIFETQWIDPKDKLPEEGERIVVKIEGEDGICITSSLYTENWQNSYFHFSLGWMPADNVVF